MPIQTLTESVDRLKTETHDLRDHVQNLEEELRRQTAATRLAIGAVFLLLACTIVAAFMVTLDNKRDIEANNRRWCPVVEPLAPRPGDPEPAGTPEQKERSLRIRVAFADLAHEWCGTPVPRDVQPAD